ncbi:MAG: C-terminal binding protein [Thermoguttaceae bacterium]|nr:C-terminal binding protein [Thermoguttaceae bacterium]MDW8039296.1 C-terminal binding protein [Thermoguttaceae bacterium]
MGAALPSYRVLITDFLSDDLIPERRVLADLAEVVALGATNEDQLLGHVEDADALIVYHVIQITEKTIQRLKRCKLIVRGGVGVDNVDGKACRQRGIPLANVPDYGTEEVADTALAMMLSLVRGVHLLNSRLRAGLGPWSYVQAAPVFRLRGRVLGIVGLGRIGTTMALRGKALGMEVWFYDPYKPDGYDKALGIRRAETLEELARSAYVLSIHCPLTEETRRMIDGRIIRLMPEGSFLINTARGGIVAAEAVLEALAEGHLAGAGLDVLEQEPPPEDDPLLRAWRDPTHPAHHRLIINPHSAFYSVEGLEDMRQKAAEACRRAILGLPVRNVVN